MAKPWEKYAGTSPTGSQQSGPWSKYSQPAKRVVTDEDRQRGAAAARAAHDASRDSPEQVAARERHQKHPVGQYLTDWADQVKGAFSGPLVSERGIVSDIVEGNKGLAELGMTAATGVSSLVTEPIAELATGRDQPRGSHVYQPRSRGGQQLAEQIGAVVKPVGDYFSEAVPTGFRAGAESLGASPETAAEIGEGAGRVLEAATIGTPARVARGTKPSAVAPGAEGVQAGRAASGTVTDKLPKGGTGAMGEARALGLKIPPSFAAVQPDRVGTKASGLTRQRLAGPGTVARFQVENQKITNQGIAKDVGLDPNKPLAAQIAPALARHNQIAQQVANTVQRLVPDEEFTNGFKELGGRVRDNPALKNNPQIEELRARLIDVEKMTGQQALDAIRQWRKNAKVSLQSIDDFDKHEAGRAMKEAANILEGALERAAKANGQPRLVQAFRDSRVRAAKLHDVDNALIGDNVDLSVLAAAGPENLSGALQRFARVQQEFPQLTRTQSKITPDSGALSLAFSPITLGTQRMLGKKLVGQLLDEDFQSKNFGGRAPEGPLGPAAFLEDVYDPPPRQTDAFGGPLEFEPPAGGAGGQMPSDARRLASTIDGQGDGFGSAFEFESQPGMPGRLQPSDERRLAGTTDHQNQLRMQEFDLDPPEGAVGIPVGPRRPPPPLEGGEALALELAPGFAEIEAGFGPTPIFERRSGAPEPYTGIDRRVNGVPDLTAERQRVLDRPLGTPANVGIADQLLADPAMQAAVRGDTRGNRNELNPGEDLPIGAGLERGPMVQGPEVSQFGDFERRRNVPEEPMAGFGRLTSNDDIGQMIGRERANPPQGVLDLSVEDLKALGYSDAEIAQLLGEG